MLLGQIANLVIVCVLMRRLDTKKVPLEADDRPPSSVSLPYGQYVTLAAVALTTAVYLPLASAVAAALPEGRIAIVTLGMKAVFLVTGITGVGITTVLLPHFSSLIAKLRHGQAREDLSYFMLLATLLTGPLALALFLSVESVVDLIFAKGKLAPDDLGALVRVVQYGLIQLPFHACALVAIKYLVSRRQPGVIFVASVAAIVVMVISGRMLGEVVGVSGIALGTTAASAVSALILVAYVNFHRHLPLADTLFLVFNWLIFLTAVACLHYRAYVGVIICLFSYVLLTAGHWRFMAKNAFIERPVRLTR